MKTFVNFSFRTNWNDHSNHENTLMYNKTMHVASFFKVDGQLDRTFIFLNIFCFINGIFNSKTWRDQPHIATCKWNKNHVYAFQCHFETLFHLNIVLCGNFLKHQQNKTKTQCSCIHITEKMCWMTQLLTFRCLVSSSAASDFASWESVFVVWWCTQSSSEFLRCLRKWSPDETKAVERCPAWRKPTHQIWPSPTTGWRTPRQKETCSWQPWSWRTWVGNCRQDGGVWSLYGSVSRWGYTVRCSSRGWERGALWWRKGWRPFPSHRQSSNCNTNNWTMTLFYPYWDFAMKVVDTLKSRSYSL